jgi:hypothetical protein
MWLYKKKIKRILKRDFNNNFVDEIKSILSGYNAKILKEESGVVGLISFYSLKFKIGKEKIILSSISDEEGISLLGKKEIVDEIVNKIEQ